METVRVSALGAAQTKSGQEVRSVSFVLWVTRPFNEHLAARLRRAVQLVRRLTRVQKCVNLPLIPSPELVLWCDADAHTDVTPQLAVTYSWKHRQYLIAA